MDCIDHANTTTHMLDALQRAGGGQVVPDSFTHGTSAQRQRWFRTGIESGSVKACDTFSARGL